MWGQNFLTCVSWRCRHNQSVVKSSQCKRMKWIVVTAASGLDQAAAEGKLHPSGSVLFEMKVKNPSVRREQLRLFSATLCSRTTWALGQYLKLKLWKRNGLRHRQQWNIYIHITSDCIQKKKLVFAEIKCVPFLLSAFDKNVVYLKTATICCSTF